MLSIAHIVTPVVVAPDSDLVAAQPITFETMRAAREFARGIVDVELLAAPYPDSRHMVPEWFRSTPPLDRSVLDAASFAVPRPLPLIADICDRLYQATTAEYLVYTNVDIGLMPYFYVSVARLVESGCDAMVINRRTIADGFTAIEDIPLMYADAGRLHAGHDCFVFRRDAYPSFRLGLLCLGAPMVGAGLVANLLATGRHYREYKDLHLTFHVGNDAVWRQGRNLDYLRHNRAELLGVLAQLDAQLGPFPPGHPFAAMMDYHARATEADLFPFLRPRGPKLLLYRVQRRLRLSGAGRAPRRSAPGGTQRPRW